LREPQSVRRPPASPHGDPFEPAPTPVVLVVTADANLRAAAQRVLAADGYRVLTAAHAGHAVLACLRSGPIDVLAAELSMDDVSGPALTERLRRHCRVGAAVYFAESGTAECDGLLVRPFTRDDLLAALATARAAADAWMVISAS